MNLKHLEEEILEEVSGITIPFGFGVMDKDSSIIKKESPLSLLELI